MKTSKLTLAQLKAHAIHHSLKNEGDKRFRSTWEEALNVKTFTVPAGSGGLYEFSHELIRKPTN